MPAVSLTSIASWYLGWYSTVVFLAGVTKWYLQLVSMTGIIADWYSWLVSPVGITGWYRVIAHLLTSIRNLKLPAVSS